MIFLLNFQISFFVSKFFHAQKNDIDLFKIFSWEYIFIKSSYYERKKEEKKNSPHHTPPNKYFLENKKKPKPSYLEKQPNFSFPCHPKTQPLIIVSIPKSKITSPNGTSKTPLEKDEIILSSSKISILNCVHHLFWPYPPWIVLGRGWGEIWWQSFFF